MVTYKAFSYERASVAHVHVGQMQVVDKIVFLSRAAQFALIEIVEKFRLDIAQPAVEPLRHHHQQYNQAGDAYEQPDLD